MGCKRVMVRLGKALLDEVTIPGVKLIRTVVQVVATTDWSSKEKRDRAIEMSKAALKNAGVEARESAIRAVQETMVAGVKRMESEMGVVGELTIEEVDGIEILEV